MLSIGLQLLTILLPSLRQLLGLVTLDSPALLELAVAVLLTFFLAEVLSRLPWASLLFGPRLESHFRGIRQDY